MVTLFGWLVRRCKLPVGGRKVNWATMEGGARGSTGLSYSSTLPRASKPPCLSHLHLSTIMVIRIVISPRLSLPIYRYHNLPYNHPKSLLLFVALVETIGTQNASRLDNGIFLFCLSKVIMGYIWRNVFERKYFLFDMSVCSAVYLSLLTCFQQTSFQMIILF